MKEVKENMTIDVIQGLCQFWLFNDRNFAAPEWV